MKNNKLILISSILKWNSVTAAVYLHGTKVADLYSIREFSTSITKLASQPEPDDLIERSLKLQQEMKDLMKSLDEDKEKERKIKEEKEKEEKEKEDKEKELAAREEEKPFMDQAKEKIYDLMDKQEKIEEDTGNRLQVLYEKLEDKEKAKEMFLEYRDKNQALRDMIEETGKKLQDQLDDKNISVSALEKKLNSESSGFKKNIQRLEKEEAEVYKEVQKTQEYKNDPNKYDKEREE